jgi:hypothetical protein
MTSSALTSTLNVDRLASGTGRTVTLGALTMEGAVTLNVTGGNGYTLAFTGLATISGLSSSGTATLNTAGADLRLLGGLTLNQGTLAKTGSGTLTVAGTQAYGPNTTLKVNQGTLVLKTDAGTSTSAPLAVSVNGAGAAADLESSQHLAALNLSAGSASLGAGADKVLVTLGLSVNPSASRLDLRDGAMILDYSGASPLGEVQGWVASGLNLPSGFWNGNGITSSTAAADPNYLRAVGVVDNDYQGSPVYSQFHGVVVDVSAILASLTYFGDASLDGKVDETDYAMIDNGFAMGLTGWLNGDFNYDGAVDATDYALIDNVFAMTGGGAQGAVAAALPDIGAAFDPAGAMWADGTAMGAVPDPGTLVLLGMGLTCLVARRARPV